MAEWKHAHLNQIGAVENETVLYNGFKDKIGILTANLTTPYLITFGNLSKGPMVVEMPVGNTGGMVMEHRHAGYSTAYASAAADGATCADTTSPPADVRSS